jgi:tRNA-splicing ligase RtcB
MLHSGSRGVGNKLGTYLIELAKKEMRRWFVNLPDEDLAYLPEGTEHFGAYVRGRLGAAYARLNRELMMEAVLDVLRRPFPHPGSGSSGGELPSQTTS